MQFINSLPEQRHLSILIKKRKLFLVFFCLLQIPTSIITLFDWLNTSYGLASSSLKVDFSNFFLVFEMWAIPLALPSVAPIDVPLSVP